jgi:GH25 family lysozyme M1 (1,4-beta-N-acetylmuramidase)
MGENMRIKDLKEIEDYFLSNFRSMYSCIHPCIDVTENEELCRVPTAEEIKAVVCEMNPMKAPCPQL